MTKKTKHTFQSLDGNSFGQRLKRLRNEKGLTQQVLADKIGIIRELISEYERDKLRPHHDTVTRLALALEVSSDKLLGLDGVPIPSKVPDPKIQKRILEIEKLPEAKKKILLKMIDLFLQSVNQEK